MSPYTQSASPRPDADLVQPVAVFLVNRMLDAASPILRVLAMLQPGAAPMALATAALSVAVNALGDAGIDSGEIEGLVGKMASSLVVEDAHDVQS